MMRRILHALTSLLPAPRLIYDREGSSPYLSRYYLLGNAPSAEGLDEKGNHREDAPARPHLLPRVFLHRFHRSDADGELHSHPWQWALAIVLSGGYSEERREADDTVRVRTFKPGSVNLIGTNDFHRVDLLEDESWSLFISGPKLSAWYFWDRDTGFVTPWREFLEQRQWSRQKPPFEWSLRAPDAARETFRDSIVEAINTLDEAAAKARAGLTDREREILDERFKPLVDGPFFDARNNALQRIFDQRQKQGGPTIIAANIRGHELLAMADEAEADGGILRASAESIIDELGLEPVGLEPTAPETEPVPMCGESIRMRFGTEHLTIITREFWCTLPLGHEGDHQP